MPVSALPIESLRTERLPWVDAAKVVGIWLVVLGHSWHLSREIGCFIFTFHMPLFFFLAGYLEKKRGVISTFHDSAKKLLVPYFLLNLICYVVLLFFLLTGLKNRVGYFWWMPDRFSWQECVDKPLTEILHGFGDGVAYSYLLSLPTWFLVELFFLKVMYSIINERIRGRIIFCVFIFPVIFLLVEMVGWVHNEYPFNSVFLAFPFFALGSLAKDRRWFPARTTSLKHRLLSGILGIIGLCLLGFLFRLNLTPPPPSHVNTFRQPNIHLCDYGGNIILFYLFGFLGIASVLMLCQIYTGKFKIIEIISGGTILIFAFEATLYTPVLLKIAEKNIGLDASNLLVCAGLATATILLFIIPIRLVSKYFPILLGGRRG
jgi:hypothetical protein